MRFLSVVLALALVLPGCSYGIDKRYGLDPIISPAAVETSTQDQLRIINALAVDAGVAGGAPDYYRVAEAGFNYVDDQCGAYFQQLFFLNRDRERLKGGLGAASAATAAILGVTGASAESLTIAAQAFGLGIAGTDLGSAAYLYQLPPSTTQGFVKQMLLAYREGAAERSRMIASPTAAYHAIQEYLSLCLPPTIEAKLAEHVASARAFPDPVGRAGGTSFGVNLSTPLAASREDIRAAVGAQFATGPLRTPDEPVRPTPRTPIQNNGALNEIERGLSPDILRRIKAALCVKDPELHANGFGPETRSHIRQFLAGDGARSVQSSGQEIIAANFQAVTTAAGTYPSCSDPVRNAYELGVYQRFGEDGVDGKIKAVLANRAIAVEPYDRRVGIARIRQAVAMPGPDELDDAIWPRIKVEGFLRVPGAPPRLPAGGGT